jgi:peptidoglycan/xylan/chitin deacetylase (PgdA/CDA1 family)
LFDASHSFLFFDYFRVPCRIRHTPPLRPPASIPSARWAVARWTGSSSHSRLLWIRNDSRDLQSKRPGPGCFYLDSTPIFGRVHPDASVEDYLREEPGEWRRTMLIRDATGVGYASVWRHDDGSVLLPFDPDELILNLWSERYKQLLGAAATVVLGGLARRAYYKVRPYMWRGAQIRLRRLFSRYQARTTFPRWPIEDALQTLYDALFRWTAAVARDPVPWLAPWPQGRSWACVLTHDVETDVGYRNIDPVRSVEQAFGFRSSWNLVPERYAVGDEVVQAILDAGCEVGVHGLRHDGRDLESLATLARRLPSMRSHAARWQAVGFRSPATHRVWEWMPQLGFEYDSSYPDTDPFEPQSGGCCSILPYFNGDMVELPITLPQDHTLFTILQHHDEGAWMLKTDYIRREGGMALLITHPDYLVASRVMDAYRRFLAHVASDPGVWRALPRDVNAWWRRRAISVPKLSGHSWQVAGPAADDATLRFTTEGHDSAL